MSRSRQEATREERTRTRRNVLAMGTVLAATLLSSCRDDKWRDPTNCFVRGTQLLTPMGERKIEELKIGELVTTLEGKAKPIRWIGRRRLDRPKDKQWNEDVKPVRISPGALGPNTPRTDLLISQGHRIYFDGILIRAVDILNGGSIALDTLNEAPELEYLHIMIWGHDVIFAEGAPCETLLFNRETMEAFDNIAEYERLYPLQTDRVEQPCARIYADLGGRAKLRSHLRSALSPWIDRRNEFDKVRDRLLAYGMHR